jgi:hypothetical protein
MFCDEKSSASGRGIGNGRGIPRIAENAMSGARAINTYSLLVAHCLPCRELRVKTREGC